MKFLSTRGNAYTNESYTAITKGLADDGGLFLPSTIPHIDIKKLYDKKPTYHELAFEVLNTFLYDYGEDVLKKCINSAYGGTFDSGDITPVVKLDDENYVLELWHGPTAAFKDVALQLLPHLLVEGKKKLGMNEETVILVATSGDTGKAALAGFMDVDGTRVLCFYPKDGVAQLQEIQMNTQKGDNLHVVSVEGNFDDTQTGVKKIFSDKEQIEKLKKNSMAFSSANSINFGRLCPQIVYYFSAYLQMAEKNEIELGDEIDVVVPTGNFGNILAGWYAKQMGLPLGRLICASNKNNILTDFLGDGKYNTNREFYKTMSPSMDILISSNLERLLFEASGKDAEMINDLMNSLKQSGEYKLDKKALENIKKDFDGGYAGERDTLKAIKEVWEKYNYLMDTHTAVGYAVSSKMKTSKNKKIILSTANPYKFPDSALEALGSKTSQDGFENIKALERETSTKAPASIRNLENEKILHNYSVSVDEMKKALDRVINS
ncbi:MAG: threonine synthase [Eubacteriales bacterium]